MTASSRSAVTTTLTWPPVGENFTALSRMFASATWAAIGAAFTSSSGDGSTASDHAAVLRLRA